MKYYRPEERTNGLELGITNVVEQEVKLHYKEVYDRGYQDGVNDTTPLIGHWIEAKHALGIIYFKGSECGGIDSRYPQEEAKGKYCRWCGAKMQEVS